MTIILLIAGLVVDVWLLVILHRQSVRKQLPWFASYIAWGVMLQCIQLATWLTSPKLYVAVYWWMEAIALLLIVAAVRESFLRIFTGFTSRPGFRWSVWTVIAGVVLYSAWKAVYAPPVHGNWLSPFVIGAEFAFRWGIAAIGLLTIVLSWLLQAPMDTREDAVVTGFGLASITFLANTIIVSLFGTRYVFFSKYLPAMGYFAAVFLWIKVFSHPIQEFGLKDLGMEPETVAAELRRYRAFGERIMRKK